MKQKNCNYLEATNNDLIDERLNINLDELEELDLELTDLENKLHPAGIDFNDFELDLELEDLDLDFNYEELDKIIEDLQKDLDKVIKPIEL